nr:hypothetical protein [uncultured Kingella sp.]
MRVLVRRKWLGFGVRLIGRQCLGCMAWYAAQRVIWLLIGTVGAFGLACESVLVTPKLTTLVFRLPWGLAAA